MIAQCFALRLAVTAHNQIHLGPAVLRNALNTAVGAAEPSF